MDSTTVTEVISKAVSQALASNASHGEGWESSMMVALVAVGLLIAIAFMGAVLWLSRKYMRRADEREDRLATRITQLETELTDSGSKRAKEAFEQTSVVTRALTQAADAITQSAQVNVACSETLREMKDIMRSISKERSIAVTVLDWFGTKACLAMNPRACREFQELLRKREMEQAEQAEQGVST